MPPGFAHPVLEVPPAEPAAAPWVVDHVVLGHARPKLLRTYMPVLPLDEARAALTCWAEQLEALLARHAAWA